MKKDHLSSNFIHPVTRQEKKRYPYKRIDLHSIHATKVIKGEADDYRVIGNRGSEAADFFTTYTVINQAYNEVRDKEVVLEVHELSLYLSLDHYMEGLRQAITAYGDEDIRASSTNGVWIHPIDENCLSNLNNLCDTYTLVKTYAEIPIEEAREVKRDFLTFWESYKERYRDIQSLPKTVFKEENYHLGVEKMNLDYLFYKLSEWLNKAMNRTTPIPDLIRLNSNMLHESNVAYENNSLSKLEKGNVLVVDKLRAFMYRIYLPISVIIFIFTRQFLVFAFPFVYFFGLKQTLAMLLSGYRAKVNKDFIQSHGENQSLLKMMTHNQARPSREAGLIKPLTWPLTYQNFGTTALYMAIIFYALGAWLSYSHQILLPLHISLVFGTMLLILAFTLPRLSLSKMTVSFDRGEITISRLSTVYTAQIDKLSVNRKKKRFNIIIGSEKGMTRSFVFEESEELEKIIEEVKVWAEAEHVNLELTQ